MFENRRNLELLLFHYSYNPLYSDLKKKTLKVTKQFISQIQYSYKILKMYKSVKKEKGVIKLENLIQ